MIEQQPSASQIKKDLEQIEGDLRSLRAIKRKYRVFGRIDNYSFICCGNSTAYVAGDIESAITDLTSLRKELKKLLRKIEGGRPL